MPAVARIGDTCQGHPETGEYHTCIGGGKVFANGMEIATVSLLDEETEEEDKDSEDELGGGGEPIISGSKTVFVYGKQIGRLGDPMGCGTVVSSGSPNVFAGG